MREGSLKIRRLQRQNEAGGPQWQAIRDLCCRTGNDGAPIAPERWEFFAQVWIGPYQRIFPEWTYIGECGDRVVGYLTGCPDTRRFLLQKFFNCDMPLALRLTAKISTATADQRLYLRRALGLEITPEQSFPTDIRREIRRDYPAHLHMNVEESFRRQGVGRRLVERYISDLRTMGVSGVHLYCGRGPLDFYRKLGFRELSQIHFRDFPVYALGRRLQ